VAVVITKVAGGTDTPAMVRNVPNPSPVSNPSPMPPPPTRNESILTYINSIKRSNQTLSYPPSMDLAEERAVQWLIEDDLNTAADDWDALRQRYALSTLWFIPTPAPFGTDDDNHGGTWITNLDECAWLDVACDDGQVTALFLSEKNVRGRIPNDLGLLTAMTSLQLWNNSMTGTIPSSLAAMTDLVSLGLRTNLLTGTILSSLGTLKALTSLQLWDNQLNGTIPSSLEAMKRHSFLSSASSCSSARAFDDTFSLPFVVSAVLVEHRVRRNDSSESLSSVIAPVKGHNLDSVRCDCPR
jgi:hypothetical protein